MRWSVLLLTFFLLSGCAYVPKTTTKYYLDSTRILRLNSDHSFEMNWGGMGYRGIWVEEDEKHVRLEFDELKDPFSQLISGTFSDSVWNVEFLGKNRIKVKYGFVLKRMR